jgi:hypothetical protein
MDIKRHIEFVRKIKRVEIKNQIEEVRYWQNLVKRVSVFFIDNLSASMKELQTLIKNRHQTEKIICGK